MSRLGGLAYKICTDKKTWPRATQLLRKAKLHMQRLTISASARAAAFRLLASSSSFCLFAFTLSFDNLSFSAFLLSTSNLAFCSCCSLAALLFKSLLSIPSPRRLINWSVHHGETNEQGLDCDEGPSMADLHIEPSDPRNELMRNKQKVRDPSQWRDHTLQTRNQWLWAHFVNLGHRTNHLIGHSMMKRLGRRLLSSPGGELYANLRNSSQRYSQATLYLQCKGSSTIISFIIAQPDVLPNFRPALPMQSVYKCRG